jgi:hypothetical protein
MTERMKRSLITTALLSLGVFLTIMALTMIGIIGRAHAQGLGASPDDPEGLFVQMYGFIKNGEHLPAVGAGVMLFVWLLRWGHTKLPAPIGPFFKTKLGGYLLGFGTAANVYLGTALMANKGWTIGLLVQAVGVGFTAAGSWDAVKDLMKKDAGTKAVITTLTLALLVVSVTACRPIKQEGGRIGGDVVDCTVGELVNLGGLIPTILPSLGEAPEWNVVAAQLEQAGGRVGTCVLAMLVDRWRSNAKLATPEGSVAADAALKAFKAKFHVAVVKTQFGAR